MADRSLGAVIQYLRTVAGPPQANEVSDQELLARFADSRDDSAFAALLRRHGPMVHGVCRRLLGREPDADDAFQATFLVLLRKARSIRKRVGVAHESRHRQHSPR